MWKDTLLLKYQAKKYYLLIPKITFIKLYIDL